MERMSTQYGPSFDASSFASEVGSTNMISSRSWATALINALLCKELGYSSYKCTALHYSPYPYYCVMGQSVSFETTIVRPLPAWRLSSRLTDHLPFEPDVSSLGSSIHYLVKEVAEESKGPPLLQSRAKAVKEPSLVNEQSTGLLTRFREEQDSEGRKPEGGQGKGRPKDLPCLPSDKAKPDRDREPPHLYPAAQRNK
ncbi:hypothetical protein SUGI_1225020 [Cryptomeria japonica]|uniref:Uncharacterized protein n=1 Tax=Cryptomeria japonica TaxID=3369 RepID=A0AAD3NRS7_CRYJA|nr:hypothetical protein SUGI_1225020 [Cryptomeria japonica]